MSGVGIEEMVQEGGQLRVRGSEGFTFALVDRNRSAWTEEQRRAILYRCIKEMQLRIEHGSWSEEWLGWKSS